MADASFQSTPLSRGETSPLISSPVFPEFQSTPLSRGETIFLLPLLPLLTYFNPLPSHEGRPSDAISYLHGRYISIHSPLTRGDPVVGVLNTRHDISIHSPLTRGDICFPTCSGAYSIFQSTPFSRRETCFCLAWVYCCFNFNPLPSHEGRHLAIFCCVLATQISIHSLLTKGDKYLEHGWGDPNFISIHSLLTKGDR